MIRGKKILFVAAHRPNRSPSQRYRFEQYFDALSANGFKFKLAYIISAKDDALFYADGKWFLKSILIFKFFIKRCVHVCQSFSYDFIFIQREAFFIGPPIFEYLFKLTGKKIIFDFDDAIWLPNVSDANKGLVKLKYPQKISSIIKLSNIVIAGNNYLKNYALLYNSDIRIIPSTIDLNYYVKSNNERVAEPICIGWSGSSTTVQHFKTLEPVLAKLRLEYGDKIIFKVYGDPSYKNADLSIEGIKWSSDTEVDVINSFDIGLMPLPDNEWTKGKCAMKALQYMALEIPVVVSPIGVNKDIIEDGFNGYLAFNEIDWYEKLTRLICNHELRKTIGKEGFLTVKNEFSTQSQVGNFLSVFST